MLCPDCWGLGDDNKKYEFNTCKTCGGCGKINCCEGEQSQQTPPTQETPTMPLESFRPPNAT